MTGITGTDFTNDSCVGVNLLYGKLPPGTRPRAPAPGGRLVSGQTFDLSADSFADGMAGTMPRNSAPGRIRGGLLYLGPLNLPARIISHRMRRYTPGYREPVIEDAQVRFYISEDGITGVLGGRILVDQVVAKFSEDPLLATVSGIVSRQAPGLADIDVDGSPDSCEMGSIAIVLSGVPAVRGNVMAGP